MAEDPAKKKKGIFAKGKNLFKKITKDKKSKRQRHKVYFYVDRAL